MGQVKQALYAYALQARSQSMDTSAPSQFRFPYTGKTTADRPGAPLLLLCTYNYANIIIGNMHGTRVRGTRGTGTTPALVHGIYAIHTASTVLYILSYLITSAFAVSFSDLKVSIPKSNYVLLSRDREAYAHARAQAHYRS